MSSFEFITAKKIICAPGATDNIAVYCQQLAMQRPLLVTDAGVMQAGLATPMIALMEQAGIAVSVYSEVVADPLKR